MLQDKFAVFKFVKTSLHGQFWQIKHRARVGYLIDASQKNLPNCIYIAKKRLQLLEIGGDQGIDYIRRSSKLIFYNLKVWEKEYFFVGELLSWIRFLSFDFLHFGGAISRFHAFYLIDSNKPHKLSNPMRIQYEDLVYKPDCTKQSI